MSTPVSEPVLEMVVRLHHRAVQEERRNGDEGEDVEEAGDTCRASGGGHRWDADWVAARVGSSL